MTDKEGLLKNYLRNAEEAITFIEKRDAFPISTNLIWQILAYELGHSDNPPEIIFHQLTALEIANLVEGFFSYSGSPIGELSFNYSILPEELNDSIQKARIKFDGEIWTIHKNDVDPFPSQPLAYNYKEGYKLHLGNGGLYRKKDFIGNIRKKDFILLRQRIIAEIQIELPPLQQG
jgi:hypothetical protein